MSRRRPIIAVTGPDKGGFPAWLFTWIAVTRAGGRAIRLRPGVYTAGDKIPGFDGLIIGGGADVDPGRYGGELLELIEKGAPTRRRHSLARIGAWLLAPALYVLRRFFSLSAGGVDHSRDAFEEKCLSIALKRGLPVLGICRGSQFMNVMLGGSLHTRLHDFYGEVGNISTVYPRKSVTLSRGSLLQRLVGSERLMVNSLHNQAVKNLGSEIVVSARDDAGVVQAIEYTKRLFVVGVQWHPEYLPFQRRQRRLFEGLVEAALKARAARLRRRKSRGSQVSRRDPSPPGDGATS